MMVKEKFDAQQLLILLYNKDTQLMANMNDKCVNVLKSLNENFYQACWELNTFMKDTLQWYDEVEKILEKDFSATLENPDHILSNNQRGKKINKKITKNSTVSTSSILDNVKGRKSSKTQNDSVLQKTRCEQISPATKTFQFSNVSNKKEMCLATIKKECSIISSSNSANETFVMPQTRLTRSKLNAAENLTNETFVLPQTALSRTKPINKKKKEKSEVNDKRQEKGDSVLKCSNQNFQNDISHQESIEVKDIKGMSKTLEEKEYESLQKKNSVDKIEKPPRVKISRTLSKSPAKRPSKISRTCHEISAKTSSNDLENSYENLTKNLSEILETPKFDSKIISNEDEMFLNINGSEKENNALRNTLKLSNSLDMQYSKILIPNFPVSSPLRRSSSLKGSDLLNKNAESTRLSVGKNKKSNSLEDFFKINNSITNGSEVQHENSKNTATFLVSAIKEKEMSFEKNETKTSQLVGETFMKFSKTSTPVPSKERIMSFGSSSNKKNDKHSDQVDFDTTNVIAKLNRESLNLVENTTKILENKKKTKKEIYEENVEEVAPTVRMTRTKTKALQQMSDRPEIKQLNELSVFAKKLVNKAKKNSLKKNQIATLLEKNLITPAKPIGYLPKEVLSSKSKYHLLLSSTKKKKTPLATLPNSVIKIVKASEDKSRLKPKIARRDSSVENSEQEKEEKLKEKQKKEEEAAAKRQHVIKSKQAELKRKNERKHQLAMKQREKLEQEKYKNMIQSEKEKEERHKLILQERQMKMKEEAFKKKMLAQQKIAETIERRRIEEEARIAKLKEMEAEEQRIALEKQKEQEMLEKRAQERLAQKKAREEYELQLKKELEAEKMKAEKSAKKKLPSVSKPQPSKRQKFEFFKEQKEEWDYKPRNENDYGLENEESYIDSEDENNYKKVMKSPVPWVKKTLKNVKQSSHLVCLDMLCEYMPCIQKTPDINKMFNITPTKKIKRNSSAIWNTPSS